MIERKPICGVCSASATKLLDEQCQYLLYGMFRMSHWCATHSLCSKVSILHKCQQFTFTTSWKSMSVCIALNLAVLSGRVMWNPNHNQTNDISEMSATKILWWWRPDLICSNTLFDRSKINAIFQVTEYFTVLISSYLLKQHLPIVFMRRRLPFMNYIILNILNQGCVYGKREYKGKN